MSFLSSILGGNKVSPEEREASLAYLTEEMRLAAYQDDAAQEYNNAMMRWGGAFERGDGQAAREIRERAEKMASVNGELVKRHAQLSVPVPEKAAGMYTAWHMTYLILKEWADSIAALSRVVEEDGVDGVSPSARLRAQSLLADEEQARKKAMKEQERVMKPLSLKASDIQRLIAESERPPE